MNTYRLLILLLAFGLFGCKIKTNSIYSHSGNNTIKLDFKSNSSTKSSLVGRVIDMQTKEAIPFVQIRLLDENETVFGALADIDGNFTLENLELGEYRLIINSIDYELFETSFRIKEHWICTAEVQLSRMQIINEKPVIYLYPEQKQKVHVKLNFKGTLSHTYPKYPEEGWQISAEPDGTLWDENNQEYYALFWEGQAFQQIIPRDGFIVSGKETAKFLEEKLAYLGLNRREANEFIVYWLPRMEDNPYNFIHFSGEPYEQQAPLLIDPKPETIIRVMMLTKPLEKKINFPLQDISALKKTRKGFSVVEWGGAVLKNLPLLEDLSYN